MGYGHFRHVRRITGTKVGIYSDGLTTLVMLDEDIANTTQLKGGKGTLKDFKIRANDTNMYPSILFEGAHGLVLAYCGTTSNKITFCKQAVEVATIFHGGDTLGGVLGLRETTTPTAVTNWGALYTKADNHLYFQDGAGVEHDMGSP